MIECLVSWTSTEVKSHHLNICAHLTVVTTGTFVGLSKCSDTVDHQKLMDRL